MRGAALVYLSKAGKLHLAGEICKSIILVSHSLVRNSSDVFLVVGQGRFAARAWPAIKIPKWRTDLGRQHWAFVPNRFVWIFVERIEDWQFIPPDWVVTQPRDTNLRVCGSSEEG